MPKGLPKKVKMCLTKSRESALLAIETYNKPAITFKSGAYIVLMQIAWTALFHAIFFKRKIKPFYRKKNSNRFEKKEGDYCYWELRTCLKEYYATDTNHPIRKNLEFFIPLRNKIEHKSLPEIDGDIFAECQASLLNYDKIVSEEFEPKYCLRESLSFSLQLFPSPKNLVDALKSNSDSKEVIEFINKFRSSLSTDIIESGQYSFKAFLVQVANHNSSSALPIQFVKYDELNPEEKKNVGRVAALIKKVDVPVNHSNLFRPGEVVKQVQDTLGNKKIETRGKTCNFVTTHVHTQCWKYYKVRPKSGSTSPKDTNPKYCLYDNKDNNYGYTKEWINFLTSELQDEERYSQILRTK